MTENLRQALYINPSSTQRVAKVWRVAWKLASSMEKDPDCPPKRIAEIRSAYEDFKKEAKKRKTAVKNGESTVSEFRDWTLRQLDFILISK